MSKGVLPLDILKYDITLNTGYFETSKYIEDDQMSVIAGNFDGAGLSAGSLQYNLAAANRLTELWQYMINNFEAVCIAAFGANTTEYNNWKTAMLSAVQADRVNFGTSITDPNNNHTIIEPYKTSLATIMKSAECKAKYYAMRDAYYWGNPFDLFRQMTCTSRMALASFFDVYINKGRYYPCNLIQADFDVIDANGALSDTEKERQKIVQINERANSEENGLNDASSATFAYRRNCMRDQGGSGYSPTTQFDMNQEPAINEKTNTTGMKLGNYDVQKVMLGTTQISKVYLGAAALGTLKTQYTTTKVPTTQFRTNPNSYLGLGAATLVNLNAGQPLWIDVTNFVACRTYYTIDGSTPTTASPKYTQALTFTTSCTLKTLTVSVNGNAEAVKSIAIGIAAVKPSYRYIKIQGYGASPADVNTRMIEVEVVSGGTNIMSTAVGTTTILSYDTINAGSTNVNTIRDGVKTVTSGTYPIWWTALPNANVVVDFGSQKAFDSMAYYSYATSGDNRANRFRILGSNTNNGTDWATVWDMSANTALQGATPAGYSITF